MDLLTYGGIAVVAILIGLAEVFKKLGLPIKFVPLACVTLGVAFGIIIYNHDLMHGILLGLATGLSSVGLYSATKNVSEGIK
jgi:uncharacterized membrane protein